MKKIMLAVCTLGLCIGISALGVYSVDFRIDTQFLPDLPGIDFDFPSERPAGPILKVRARLFGPDGLIASEENLFPLYELAEQNECDPVENGDCRGSQLDRYYIANSFHVFFSKHPILKKKGCYRIILDRFQNVCDRQCRSTVHGIQFPGLCDLNKGCTAWERHIPQEAEFEIPDQRIPGDLRPTKCSKKSKNR